MAQGKHCGLYVATDVRQASFTTPGFTWLFLEGAFIIFCGELMVKVCNMVKKYGAISPFANFQFSPSPW
jgi:hypothetical protein